MPAPYPELQAALSVFLDRLDGELRGDGYAGEPVRMYLAGGLAVNYYCGTRYTGDIDASFSRRILLQDETLVLEYRKRDGSDALLYFDRNYNTAFALLHEDYEADSVEWAGIGNERRLVQLRVLAPLDLAVSKVARFSEQDRQDIRDLARVAGFTIDALRARAGEALRDFVGNRAPVMTSLDLLERDLRADGRGD
ncbi:MAG TPA: DUF6036 family nucleotidyltransferase [Rariglobus sp.]